jgi:hypothetical protein
MVVAILMMLFWLMVATMNSNVITSFLYNRFIERYSNQYITWFFVWDNNCSIPLANRYINTGETK